MDEQERIELFKELEAQGWEPQLCDRAIPFFDNPVRCGQPTGIGDLDYDTMMIPSGWTSLDSVFCTTAKGDSMIGANIMEGDRLIVEETNVFEDGDILLVSIDEEYTLKTFCRDDNGTPWLIPQNPAYKAFPLKERQNIWVKGVVRRVIKNSPRISYRVCKNAITQAKAELAGTKEISQQQVEQAIREVAPMIKVARQWYAVFRAMVDAGVISKKAYDTFCSTVRREVPEHEHLPVSDEIQRLAIQSFAKPVNKWTADDAPVKGKRFDEYLKIARQMSELLGIL